MSEAIIVAIISGFVTLSGTGLSVFAVSKKGEETLRVAQAVTDAKIEELTRAVQKHNNFAERLPVLEEKMRVANHRIDDLEKECKK